MDMQSVTLNVKNECMEMNEEGNGETQGPVQIETQPNQMVFGSNHCERADAWKEFVSVGKGEDGKERCRCIHCGKVLVIPIFTSNLWRHLRRCPMKPKTKSGGTEEQYIEGVSNNSLLKKRQCSSISWGKTRSAMLLGLDVLDCSICFEALTIPIFQKRLLCALQCFNEPHGLFVTVRCIAPSALELGNLAYCLYYSMDGHTLTYKSPEVKRVLQVSSETPQDNFMFIPHSLLRGELLEKKITIGLKLSKFSKQNLWQVSVCFPS